MVDSQTVRMKVSSEDLRSSFVPEDVFKRPTEDPAAKLTSIGADIDAANFRLTFGADTDKTPIIDTLNRKILLSDKFSEMGFIVPTRRLFGLGQRNGKFQLDSGAYTLFARGRKESLPLEDYLGGNSGNHIHPFILGQAKDKTYFGMFFVNAGP